MGKKVNLSVEFEAAIGVFKPTREGKRDYRIKTKLGALDVSLHEGDDQPWLAAIWDDVEKARVHFGVKKVLPQLNRLNPYSGKWNWHWFQQWPQGNKARKADRIEAGRKMIAAFVEEVKELV
jgi:hypothetical protein